eukprot:COSAG01_NODE_11445_length_1931_cov_1.588428_2_plen_418_part_00
MDHSARRRTASIGRRIGRSPAAHRGRPQNDPRVLRGNHLHLSADADVLALMLGLQPRRVAATTHALLPVLLLHSLLLRLSVVVPVVCWAATNLQPGDSFSAGGCEVKVLGCYWDNAMGKGVDGKVVREFPYNVPGCYDCTPAQGGCLKAPDPPQCDAGVMSNEYCAVACINYAPRIPKMTSIIYAASQAGYACFCGSDTDAQHAAATDKSVGWDECNAECGCPTGQNNAYCGGKGLSPRGKAGETCGGPWKNAVMRIDCGLRWGWQFLIVFALGGCAYIGLGVARPCFRNKGLPLRQMLSVHPHYAHWREVAALCRDGLHYAQARVHGRQPVARREVTKASSPQSASSSKASKRGSQSSDSGKGPKKKGKSQSKSKSKSKNAASAEEVRESLVGSGDRSGATGTAAGGGGRWVRVPD